MKSIIFSFSVIVALATAPALASETKDDAKAKDTSVETNKETKNKKATKAKAKKTESKDEKSEATSESSKDAKDEKAQKRPNARVKKTVKTKEILATKANISELPNDVRVVQEALSCIQNARAQLDKKPERNVSTVAPMSIERALKECTSSL